MRTARLAAIVGSLAIALTLAACSGQAATQDVPAEPTATAAVPAAAVLSSVTPPAGIGTRWTTLRAPGGSTPISFSVSGPWKFGAGKGWRTSACEIVDPKTVPSAERFKDATLAVRSRGRAGTDYVLYRVGATWWDHLGTVRVRGAKVSPDPLPQPQHFIPLVFEIGKTYSVEESSAYTMSTTVLAKSTADLPAGKIEDAYLMRFVYAPTDGNTAPTVYYYIFASDKGCVAVIRPTAGDEASGFTAAGLVDVLATMPSR